MDSYLASVKEQLACRPTDATVHAVIGNEACDLDSTVSALVYAYFLHKTRSDSGVVVVPTLNIPSSEFRLRTEVTFALGQHRVQPEWLVFRDQLDLPGLHARGRLRLTLVDFNMLPASDAGLEKAVVEVLDHHQRERPDTDGVEVNVEMVGSCCTLVAERVSKQEQFELPSMAIQLLYSTILLDTVCLSEEAGRTTPKDLAIIDSLESQLTEPDRRAVFDSIQAAKFDVSGLTVQELLRKDLKVVTSDTMMVAFSSIPIHMKDFLRLPHVEADLAAFSQQQSASVTIVMSLHVDDHGQPSRQLAVYAEDSAREHGDQVRQCLSDSSSPDLRLTPLEGGGGGAPYSWPITLLSVYSQGNVAASRKKVLPLIKSCIQSATGAQLQQQQ